MAKYYYLIAGLPDISFSEEKPSYTLSQFRDEVYDAVSEKDRKLLDMVFLTVDHENLVSLLDAFIKGKTSDELTEMPLKSDQGLFSTSQLVALIQAAAESEKCPSELPKYMYDFVQLVLDENNQTSQFREDVLSSMFYDYAAGIRNAFVRNWMLFNRDLANIQTAMTARKYGLDASALIVGNDVVAQALKTSGARDWGLTGTVDFLDELVRINEEKDLTQREKMIDIMRWNWLDENSFFNYFTIEKLFAMLEKIRIAERWYKLDKEAGQKLFRMLISDLKQQVEVPQEFENN